MTNFEEINAMCLVLGIYYSKTNLKILCHACHVHNSISKLLWVVHTREWRAINSVFINKYVIFVMASSSLFFMYNKMNAYVFVTYIFGLYIHIWTLPRKEYVRNYNINTFFSIHLNVTVIERIYVTSKLQVFCILLDDKQLRWMNLVTNPKVIFAGQYKGN